MLKATTWVQHSIDSHPFRSMSMGHPIPEIQLFQNLILKSQGQGHGWGECWKSQQGSNILSTHIPFITCQSAIPFLRYDFFKIWPWKSVKVMDDIKVESHIVDVTSYWFTSFSFHVNRPSHSWDTAFSKFDLENPGQSQMTMMLHNCMYRQFHRTSNGKNPSSSFRDMGSAKSGPSAAWFHKFWPMGKSIWGKWANKQRVLMHRHQGLNVRHGLCHIYMRYLYIYELFIAFVCFVVCSLL